jgi:hypothetical protein
MARRARRQEQEAVVEAGAAGGRPCPGSIRRGSWGIRSKRSYINRARRPCAASRFAERRAVRKTSPRTCSMRSRMRRPPCTVRRISQPMRPGRARTSGAPEHHGRARSISKSISAAQPGVASGPRDLGLVDTEMREIGPAAGRCAVFFQSMATSCQKLINCRPSRCSRNGAGFWRGCGRTDAAAAGRPGWPSGGSSRAVRHSRRSAS